MTPFFFERLKAQLKFFPEDVLSIGLEGLDHTKLLPVVLDIGLQRNNADDSTVEAKLRDLLDGCDRKHPHGGDF